MESHSMDDVFEIFLGKGPSNYRATKHRKSRTFAVAADAGINRRDSYVVALAHVRPRRELHACNIVLPHVREQIQFWQQAMGVREELWEFSVECLLPLREHVVQKHVCLRSQAGQTYRVVTAIDVLIDALTDENDDMPLWASRSLEAQPSALLTVPYLFAEGLLSGSVREFVLPSPFGRGPFRSPKWFQDALQPHLRAAMRANGFADHCVETEELWHKDHGAFNMHSCQELADDLRKCVEQAPHLQAILVPWLQKLQHSADELQGLPFFHARRSVGDLIQFTLFADLARDSRHLKELGSYELEWVEVLGSSWNPIHLQFVEIRGLV
eukprot:6492755-Amphidinium_carterae.1